MRVAPSAVGITTIVVLSNTGASSPVTLLKVARLTFRDGTKTGVDSTSDNGFNAPITSTYRGRAQITPSAIIARYMASHI